MFRLWIERRFSRPVTAAGAVLKPQGVNCAVLPKVFAVRKLFDDSIIA